MQDSYGDGWNGGSLKVYQNTTLLGTYSASQFATAQTFTLCPGDSIHLTYTPGSYENENTYQLYDAQWNVLFHDGPTPLTGSVYNAPVVCTGTIIPGNHACTATLIDTAVTYTVNNSGMASSTLNAGCANFQGGDLWFKIPIPLSGNLSVRTDSGSLADTGLGLWLGSSCASVHKVACDDDAGNGYYSFLMFTEQNPGDTLYIQAWGYNGSQGSFTLRVNDLGTVHLDSSRLPIVQFITGGQSIPEGTKINMPLKIRYNGLSAMTHLSDPPTVYNGQAGIEVRGASSSGYPQKPYNFETRTATGTNNNVPLLGMPAENDWVLVSNFNDRSLIRNALAFDLFRWMGQPSPRHQLCEVLLDSNYRGIYLLCEKIKQDSARVPIATLKPDDSTDDALTGGYILQQNYWDANNSFQSNYSPIDHPGFDIHFVYQDPAPTDITAPQKIYIQHYIDSLETALYSAQFRDTSNGYARYLDKQSFIDYFIVNELSRNNDGFKKSVFFYKDRYSKGGKLKAGPVWDFDWAWKTLATGPLFENNDGSGWAYHINDYPTDNYSCGYYVRLLQDTNFANALRCRYEQLRSGILDTVFLFHYIDSVQLRVQDAQQRHFQKWPILGMSGPAPEVNAIATTYPAELDTLKHWIATRLHWLDDSIPGHCWPQTPNGIKSAETASIQIHPNPSTGEWWVNNLPNEAVEVTLYRSTGECVWQKNIYPDQGQIHLSYPHPGLYELKLKSSSLGSRHQKILIR